MRLYSFHKLTTFSFLLLAISAFAGEPLSTGTPIPEPAHQVVSPQATPPKMANTVDWTTDYNTARERGRESNRPVMLFVTMKGCRYCTKLSNESFKSDAVAKELADSFVPTKLYLSPDSKLGKSLKITLFPTTMVIAPDGTIVDYIRGYVPREEFEGRLLASKRKSDERIKVAQAKLAETTLAQAEPVGPQADNR